MVDTCPQTGKACASGVPLVAGCVHAQVPRDDRGNEQVDPVGAFPAARCAWCTRPAALAVGEPDAGWMPVVGGQNAGAGVVGMFTHRMPWGTSARFDAGGEVLHRHNENRLELRYAASPFSPACW
jgi:hypothetical protein